MRIFSLNLLLLFLLNFSGTAYAQGSPVISDKTEIIVIGTVHESSSGFSSDTLLRVFNKIKPDVILVESDTSYFESDFRLKEEIAYMFPETQAISEYSKVHSVSLRPYDINGRDIFLDDPERLNSQYGFFSIISSLKEEGNLNSKAENIYSKIQMMIELAGKMSESELSYMNSEEGSAIIDTINYYTYEGLKQLIDLTPELSEYKEYWKEEYEYWNKRNSTMVSNILRISKKFKGKKIIVLCGFAHKKIILKELKKKSGEYELKIKNLTDL